MAKYKFPFGAYRDKGELEYLYGSCFHGAKWKLLIRFWKQIAFKTLKCYLQELVHLKDWLKFQVKQQLPNLLYVIVYDDVVSKEQMDQNVMDWATFIKIGSLISTIFFPQ